MRPQVRSSFIGLVILSVATAMAGPAGAAAPFSQASSRKPLNLHFTRVAQGYVVGISQDRYLLITSSPQPPALPLVIDDTTYHASTIPAPGSTCTALGISGTNVIFSCGSRWQPDVRAYSFIKNALQPVPQFNSGCQPDDITCGAEPTAVGAEWIEYGITPCYHCNGYSGPAFQNLHSGTVVKAQPSPTTVANLDVPRVVQPICSPLRVPRDGSLTRIGRFALASSPRKSLVEKCGSKRPVLTITGYVPFSPTPRRAIVWQQGTEPTLRGIELPSLQRFAIALPKRIFANAATLTTVLFTSRTLYLETLNQANQRSEVWAARAKNL
jgi:hypothetical protein